ncbi:hypothetical protein NKG05_15960 [Oerskovia sp. M15]
MIAPNPNVFLVLSGHEHGVAINVKGSVGSPGNGVTALLADYQFYEVTAEEAGLTEIGGYAPDQGLRLGSSFFRLLQFDVDRSELVVDTYSPWLDNFGATEYDTSDRYNGTEDNFTVPIELATRTTSLQTDAVTVFSPTDEVIGRATVPSGEIASVTWAAPKPGTVHAWTVEATSSAGGAAASQAAVFTTVADKTAPSWPSAHRRRVGSWPGPSRSRARRPTSAGPGSTR